MNTVQIDVEVLAATIRRAYGDGVSAGIAFGMDTGPSPTQLYDASKYTIPSAPQAEQPPQAVDLDSTNFLAGARMEAARAQQSVEKMTEGRLSITDLGAVGLDMQLLAERVAKLYATPPTVPRDAVVGQSPYDNDAGLDGIDRHKADPHAHLPNEAVSKAAQLKPDVTGKPVNPEAANRLAVDRFY